jgi:single-stranded-DNA-specific exonuclease
VKQWRQIPTDDAAATTLQADLNIDLLLCQLLAQRGIRTYDAAKAFFRPDLKALHDPFLMRDMNVAVERLDEALRNNERILLYGDYDVDGTTSVALMYDFLSRFYRNLDYYLPDRDREGYGVSLEGVAYAQRTGCKLVVAMDCGIKAHKAIAAAQEAGIDFIVCDHHLPEGDLPPAVANLDPKRPDCPYPFKELSGCGIAFKLAQALAMRNNLPIEELEWLLDFVAVSIACDVVPIDGENRILAYYGLQKINREPHLGLWALIKCINRPLPLDVVDLVFGLGPLINAAGRLGDAREAVRLLLSADRESALNAANALETRNLQRRAVDHATTEVALSRVQPNDNRKSIVLFDPEWHKGIIGITASRMVERFHRPVVILTESDGKAVGSARSVPGLDLYSALLRCESLFSSFGGHAHAAGLQMPVENVPLFEQQFEAIVREQIRPYCEKPTEEVHAEVELEQITPAFWRILKQFAPFGPENRNPVFLARNVVAAQHKVLDNNHVRLSLRHTNGTLEQPAIAFNLADIFVTLNEQPFDVLFSLRADTWKGKTTLTLYIKDMRLVDEAPLEWIE